MSYSMPLIIIILLVYYIIIINRIAQDRDRWPALVHGVMNLDVCLSMHRCICVEKKNQLDATEWFIAVTIWPTCFGHRSARNLLSIL